MRRITCNLLLPVALCVSASCLWGDETGSLGPVLGAGSGYTLYAGSSTDSGWIEALSRGANAGDGGGADVVGPLKVIQTHYSDPTEGNVALLIWDETVANPHGVRILVDGELVSTVLNPGGPDPATLGFVFVSSIDPGRHQFRVEEAEVDEPTFASGSLTILAAPPFADPRDVSCNARPGRAGTCELVLRWTNPDPIPSYYLLLLDQLEHEQIIDGAVHESVVSGIGAGTYSARIVGFLEASPGNLNALYRGEFVQTECVADCEPNDDRTFLRGVCGGQANTPQLTNAIFALNYLFIGGIVPECLEACEVDGDDELTLTDPIYLLNFLFLGGPPLVGWIDQDGDGRADPTCATAPVSRCAVSQSACP